MRNRQGRESSERERDGRRKGGREEEREGEGGREGVAERRENVKIGLHGIYSHATLFFHF